MDNAPPEANCYDGVPVVEDDIFEREPTTLPSDEALLLQYHCCFGHISFQLLKAMAEIGIIPKRLAKCSTPVCSACMYAKATKCPWRSKPQKDYQNTQHLDPGNVISVDQMVSPTPGFIAQISGILTTKRYCHATVYVDQATKFGYTHLQKTATAEETLESKIAFEKLLSPKVFVSRHTTLTMVSSEPANGRKPAQNRAKVSPLQVSMPITQMGLLRNSSAISRTSQEVS